MKKKDECDCGNIATIPYLRGRICERCKRIQDKIRDDPEFNRTDHERERKAA